MKYIFFDIDGTLVDVVDGKEHIHSSTLRALKALEKKGHITAIASGRSYTTVKPVCEQLGIHYAVSDGGYGVMMEDTLIHVDPLEKETYLPLCEELLEKKIPFAFMKDHSGDVYATKQMMANQSSFDFEGMKLVIDNSFDYTKEAPFKIFMGVHRGQEDRIETVDAHKIMRYFDHCIAFEPDDKYRGVTEIVEKLGGNKEDIIFFGDGKNDMAMFEKIPMSIAMGNAIEELKEMAYFITKNIDNDGIEYACQYLKLID